MWFCGFVVLWFVLWWLWLWLWLWLLVGNGCEDREDGRGVLHSFYGG